MCLNLIEKYEGCKLQAYKCPMGVWTIGWGNTTLADGTPVKENDIITQEYADALLRDYLIKNIYPVWQKIPYTLTEDQKEALASLCYNIGVPTFLKSKLYTAICKKDMAEICRQWDFGYKNNLKGLFKRRTEELYLFFKGL